MQLSNLLSFPLAKLLTLDEDRFAIMFSSALSHLNTTKDLLSKEKETGMIAYRRNQIEKIECALAALRMHKHYQGYQNQIAVINARPQIAA
jgi:hypothetical protein